MKSIYLFFCLFCIAGPAYAQPTAMYRLHLAGKENTPYSVNRPEEFLSPKAIERRIQQSCTIDTSDLPIPPAYFQALIEAGAGIRASSKWLNTITVSTPNDEIREQVAQLPFIQSMTKVLSGYLSIEESISTNSKEQVRKQAGNTTSDPFDYGDALPQICLNNALPLHEKGHKGSGMTIALMDAGFSNVDLYPQIFDPGKIREVKNFTHQEGDPYRSPEQHGTIVLSCLLANDPGSMIGTAPEANYYLFKTEVNGEEYPVEEDYWVAALEYADSLGVDIVSTSLGYTTFNDEQMNHRWEEMDGESIPASRAASMAASKGMLLFIAAGNEGSRAWEKVSVPSDAKNILTVGAVGRDSIWASFSSHGAADQRIKPDVMALGLQTCIVNASGQVTTSRGTSYATPVLAGMGACLWEALPNFTALELIQLIKEHSDRYSNPDEYYGYGLPDIAKSYDQATGSNKLISVRTRNDQILYWDSIDKRMYFDSGKPARWTIYSYAGVQFFEQDLHTRTLDVSFLPQGTYIALVLSGGKYYVCKFQTPNF